MHEKELPPMILLSVLKGIEVVGEVCEESGTA
jgi:hypothetical protein